MGYIEGYPNPALVLEGHPLGAFVSEEAADALMDFLMGVAQLSPENIQLAP